jgi:hypothetical protein
MSRHTAVGGNRTILSATEPRDRLVDCALDSGVVLGNAAAIVSPFRACARR